MKPLEAYHKIDNTLCLNNNSNNLRFNIDTDDHIDCENVVEMVDCLNLVKKNLEALEIVKKKRIDVGLLDKVDNVNDYNWNLNNGKYLRYEDFDLLKEVLNDRKRS